MIIGPRIRLRRPEREDLPLFVTWLNDQEVRAGLSMYLPIGLAEEEHWFEEMIRRPQEERGLAVEIPHGEGWRPIGSTSLFSFDWRIRSAEFGILIGDKTVWDQGYGTEVTQLMLDHAFGTLNLNRLQLRVNATNLRASRAYEKAGYTLEGTLREAVFDDGVYSDLHLMSVLRSEWEAAREAAPGAAPGGVSDAGAA
ncbi:MAG TPA: GNAT family protein [Anaerolineales bacterium]|nr:GNAT family protein [Anaerolineales bacterium]